MNANVPLDIVDEAANSEQVVLGPPFNGVGVHTVVVLGRHYFEEEDRAGAAGDQDFVVEEVHLAEVLVSHPLHLKVLRIVCINREGLPLPIEAVYHLILIVVETFVREIHPIALHLHLVDGAFDLVRALVVEEVVVGARVVVEKDHGDEVVAYEGAVDEGVREALDRHRVIIYSNGFIDPEILSLAHLLLPRLLRKAPEPELAVVNEDYGVLEALLILFHFFGPNIAVWLPADFLLKGLLVRLEVEHADPELAVIFLGDEDGSRGVVRYDAGNNGPLRHDLLVLDQVLELGAVVFEVLVGGEVVLAGPVLVTVSYLLLAIGLVQEAKTTKVGLVVSITFKQMITTLRLIILVR